SRHVASTKHKGQHAVIKPGRTTWAHSPLGAEVVNKDLHSPYVVGPDLNGVFLLEVLQRQPDRCQFGLIRNLRVDRACRPPQFFRRSPLKDWMYVRASA